MESSFIRIVTATLVASAMFLGVFGYHLGRSTVSVREARRNHAVQWCSHYAANPMACVVAAAARGRRVGAQ